MTPSEIKAVAVRMYGRKRWKTKLAEALGVHRVTLFRLMQQEEVRSVYAIAIAGLVEHNRRQREVSRYLKNTGRRR